MPLISINKIKIINMNMSLFRIVLILSVIVTFFSCSSSINVVSDFDGSMDFSSYKTYNYYRPDTVVELGEMPAMINTLNQRRIENAIDEEMELRGYAKSDNPDIFVNYYLRVENKTEYRATSYNYGSPYYGGYGYYGYYGGYGYTMTDVQSYDYKVGTLIIDLVDVKKHQLIWYGAGTKALRENPRHVEHEINNAVTRIFYQYKWLAGTADPVRTIQR